MKQIKVPIILAMPAKLCAALSQHNYLYLQHRSKEKQYFHDTFT
jgi:hypothetical protein